MIIEESAGKEYGDLIEEWHTSGADKEMSFAVWLGRRV